MKRVVDQQILSKVYEPIESNFESQEYRKRINWIELCKPKESIGSV